MLVIFKLGTSQADVDQVRQFFDKKKCRSHLIPGEDQISLIITSNIENVDPEELRSMPSVYNVMPIYQAFKLACREVKKQRSVINLGWVKIGGDKITVIAGPCAVESMEQVLETARHLKKAGASILRGGAFKPRTSPYSFQGLGKRGLEILKAAKEETGLLTVSEILDLKNIDLVAEYVDILQIGARNMQNFALLKEVGKTKKPVLLKRGMSATIEEFLMAAEYILAEGNYDVILCERGVRTFLQHTRNTLDLSAVLAVKELSHLPIIVDPSHGCGRRDMVIPMARAAVAIGADGIMVEVHSHPDEALSDGQQSLYPDQFTTLMEELKIIAPAVKKRI